MTQVLPVPTLSTTQFHDAVHGLSPKIAVFDCDGTLWSADAGSGFMNWTIETGLVSRETNDWIDARYRLYHRGEVSEIAMCGEMVQMYQGLRESEMRASARAFFKARIEPLHLPRDEAISSPTCTAKGVDIWAVSSSNDWAIEEGMTRFGIPPNRVLSARVHIVDGIVTDRIIEVPTDEYKVTALHRVGVTAPDAVFGNSIHDAAMLAIARRAFPVNPSPALAERSMQESWPVYYPVSVAV